MRENATPEISNRALGPGTTNGSFGLHGRGPRCVTIAEPMRFLALFLAMAAGASAGEYVVFDSGSRMRVDRHETGETRVRLFIGGAWFEVDPARVLGYEAEECAPSAAAPSPMVAAPAAPPPVAPATPAGLADAAADRYSHRRSPSSPGQNANREIGVPRAIRRA